LDLACKALQAGEISAAVVGGANLIMSPSRKPMHEDREFEIMSC
jgi:acyl transferase domain-containing protein